MNEGDKLQQILKLYPEALNDRKLLSSLLADFFPSEPLLKNLILDVYDCDILAELSETKSGTKDYYRFQKRLCDDYGLDDDYARKALDIWIEAIQNNEAFSRINAKSKKTDYNPVSDAAKTLWSSLSPERQVQVNVGEISKIIADSLIASKDLRATGAFDSYGYEATEQGNRNGIKTNYIRKTVLSGRQEIVSEIYYNDFSYIRERTYDYCPQLNPYYVEPPKRVIPPQPPNIVTPAKPPKVTSAQGYGQSAAPTSDNTSSRSTIPEKTHKKSGLWIVCAIMMFSLIWSAFNKGIDTETAKSLATFFFGIAVIAIPIQLIKLLIKSKKKQDRTRLEGRLKSSLVVLLGSTLLFVQAVFPGSTAYINRIPLFNNQSINYSSVSSEKDKTDSSTSESSIQPLDDSISETEDNASNYLDTESPKNSSAVASNSTSAAENNTQETVKAKNSAVSESADATLPAEMTEVELSESESQVASEDEIKTDSEQIATALAIAPTEAQISEISTASSLLSKDEKKDSENSDTSLGNGFGLSIETENTNNIKEEIHESISSVFSFDNTPVEEERLTVSDLVPDEYSDVNAFTLVATEIIDDKVGDRNNKSDIEENFDKLLELAPKLGGIEGLSYGSGSSGSSVKAIQRMLATSGFISSSGADGVFGDNTASGLRAFQKSSGLAETGHADLQTQFYLLASSPDVQIEKTDKGSLIISSNNYACVIWSNNDAYIGLIDAGKNIISGTYIYSNGDYYAGPFINNQRSGKGSSHFTNGDIYEGQWLNDKMNGAGVYYFGGKSANEYYDGNWKDNKMSGKGTYTTAKGYVITGTWENNVHKGW